MENLVTHKYQVNGMTCGGCVAIVKNKLSHAQGVTAVEIDLAKNEAEITSTEEITTDLLQAALSNTSYTISEINSQGNKNIQAKKGGCCG